MLWFSPQDTHPVTSASAEPQPWLEKRTREPQEQSLGDEDGTLGVRGCPMLFRFTLNDTYSL